MLDFDHPDAIDMPLFASVRAQAQLYCYYSTDRLDIQCLSDLKACKQANIPVYSFEEHQRLAETKYLYGATIIIGKLMTSLFVVQQVVNSLPSGRNYGPCRPCSEGPV
jgi:uridine kinase